MFFIYKGMGTWRLKDMWVFSPSSYPWPSSQMLGYQSPLPPSSFMLPMQCSNHSICPSESSQKLWSLRFPGMYACTDHAFMLPAWSDNRPFLRIPTCPVLAKISFHLLFCSFTRAFSLYRLGPLADQILPIVSNAYPKWILARHEMGFPSYSTT